MPRKTRAIDRSPPPTALAISIAPVIIPAKPPSVSIKSVAPMIKVGFVTFSGTISAFVLSVRLRFAPQRLQ